MFLSSYLIVALCLLLAGKVNSFVVNSGNSKRYVKSIGSLKLSSEGKPEQTITDLNLDQMLQVFNEADRKVANSVTQPKSSSSKKFNVKEEGGISGPLGFFDPIGFANDISEDQFKLFQEAEIKHGRVSMLAVLGVFFGEKYPVFFNGEIGGPAIYQFQQADAIFPFWIIVLSLIGAVEVYTISKAWQPLGDTLKAPLGLAKLRADHRPGQLGFDPLDLLVQGRDAYNNILTREINNGRLAMIGIAGIVAQELVTGEKIF